MGLMEKLNDLARGLPDTRIAELVDFAEFLHDRSTIQPKADTRSTARARLESLRSTAIVGDVTNLTEELWHAEQGRL